VREGAAHIHGVQEMSKPDVTFFGKVFDRKTAPDDERKVLSLDKGEKRADGTWKNIRATAIEFEDGTKLNLGQHLTYKTVHGQAHIGTLYFAVFPDEKKPSDFKDF
jgi:hypothetical protein